jgi:hypothetical protein
MIFKIFSPKIGKTTVVFYSKQSQIMQKFDHNTGMRKTPIFSPKISKNRRKL